MGVSGQRGLHQEAIGKRSLPYLTLLLKSMNLLGTGNFKMCVVLKTPSKKGGGESPREGKVTWTLLPNVLLSEDISQFLPHTRSIHACDGPP